MKEEILKFILMYQCCLKSLHFALKSRKFTTLKMPLTKEQRVKVINSLNFTSKIMALSLACRESTEYLVIKKSFKEVHKNTSVEI